MSEQNPQPDADPLHVVQERLVKLLDLRPAGTSDDGLILFEGDSAPQPHKRVFGGQVLGQTLIAAQRTVAADRPVHSMHGYFLRPGDLNVPITFAVENLRDGGSFSARRVHALQHDQPILSMMASFAVDAPGLDHRLTMPKGLPDPESLPSTSDVMQGIDHPVAQYWARERPIDIRHVEPNLYFGAAEQRTDRQSVWLKALGPLPEDDAVHRAVIAWASDYTLLESVLRKHGMAWTERSLRAASLDHAMWWHRPVRADQWLLFTQHSPSASGSRALGTGYFFTQDGELVATVSQELMARVALG